MLENLRGATLHGEVRTSKCVRHRKRSVVATRTAARRRAEARIVHDAYLAECPARQLLDRIADKWVGLAVDALAAGPQRYRDLDRRSAGISPKMLTETLRKLERDGLVTRRSCRRCRSEWIAG